MVSFVCGRLSAVVVLAALLGSACVNAKADPADEAAVAASEAAAVAASEAAQHLVADTAYYDDVLLAFERASAAASRSDAAAATYLYRAAAAYAAAATYASSATEAAANYPTPVGISDPSCTHFAHYHLETSCHFHARPACHAEQSLIYYEHDPAEETGHRYSTIPVCATVMDAARVTKDASHEVLHWQLAASAANAAAEAWAALSNRGE